MSKKLSPLEKDAKLSVLKEIMGEMDDLMCKGLDKKKGMKVSVMSDSKQGLEEGLDKAEDIVDGDGLPSPVGAKHKFGALEQEAGSLMGEEEYDEDSHGEPDPDTNMTSAEIDAEIARLQALKEQKAVNAPF